MMKLLDHKCTITGLVHNSFIVFGKDVAFIDINRDLFDL